jgi:hypothetical protein
VLVGAVKYRKAWQFKTLPNQLLKGEISQSNVAGNPSWK